MAVMADVPNDETSPAGDDAAGKRKDTRKLVRVKNHPGIFRRGPGYVVVARIGRGKNRQQVRRYAKTLSEARVIQGELRSDGGGLSRQGRQAFVDYARKWIEDYDGRASKTLKEQTRKGYQASLERDEFADAFAGLRLDEVTAAHLGAYARLLEKGGLSPRSIRNVVLPVRLALASACDDGLIKSNPAAGLKLRPALGHGPRQDQVRALNDEEFEHLVKALDQTTAQMRLLVEFLLQTGLRIGEAVALTWADILVVEKRVSVTARIYKDGWGEPKSEFGIRKVPLSPLMLERLKEQRRRCRKGGGGGDHQPVFVGADGDHLDYYAARRTFRSVVAKAELSLSKSLLTSGRPLVERKRGQVIKRDDLSWVGFHTLRHTCAFWLIRRRKNGGLEANPKEAQLWLGHHSPTFTMSAYGRWWEAELPDASDFDRLLQPAPALRAVSSE
jgi:integrase